MCLQADWHRDPDTGAAPVLENGGFLNASALLYMHSVAMSGGPAETESAALHRDRSHSAQRGLSESDQRRPVSAHLWKSLNGLRHHGIRGALHWQHHSKQNTDRCRQGMGKHHALEQNGAAVAHDVGNVPVMVPSAAAPAAAPWQ